MLPLVAHCVQPDLVRGSRTGDSLAAVALGVEPHRRLKDAGEGEGGAAWSVGLEAVMALDDFHVEVLAAQQGVDLDAFGRKGLLQHRHACLGLGRATHEHVKRRIAAFGPGMDGDMALRQNGDARHSTIRLEMVQMDMQQGRAGSLDAGAHRPVDMAYIGEMSSPVELDDEVRPGAVANMPRYFR